MTPETLLRKRVIVENKWPGCQFEVGDILIQDGEYYWIIGDVGWHSKVPKGEIEPFPYLMRPLQWWEERAIEDMPEYVKSGKNVYKIDKHFKMVNQNGGPDYDQPTHFISGNACGSYIFFKPATEAEYLCPACLKEMNKTKQPHP